LINLGKAAKTALLIFFLESNNKINDWLIYGFCYVKDEKIKGGRTWNDNYHLLVNFANMRLGKMLKLQSGTRLDLNL